MHVGDGYEAGGVGGHVPDEHEALGRRDAGLAELASGEGDVDVGGGDPDGDGDGAVGDEDGGQGGLELGVSGRDEAVGFVALGIAGLLDVRVYAVDRAAGGELGFVYRGEVPGDEQDVGGVDVPGRVAGARTGGGDEEGGVVGEGEFGIFGQKGKVGFC